MTFSKVGSWTCADCGKTFQKLQSYNAHRRVHSAFAMRRQKETNWCRGKTKETDLRLKKVSDTLKKRFSSGEIVPWVKGLSKDTDERLAKMSKDISKTIDQKIKDGQWHNSFAKSRRHVYKGETFDGMWEVYLAVWFDEHGIDWVRNKKSFQYVFDKPRRYTPDFYIPNIDCYVEVKGWKTPKDEAKWSQFPEKLIVFMGNDLKALGLPISVRVQKSTLIQE